MTEQEQEQEQGTGTSAGVPGRAGGGPAGDRLAQFEEQRGRLWAIAYRIMGTVTDADDAVQEAWLRWQALPGEQAVASPRGYLTTVVSRICYDLLGSARARRETYVGPWLPEPLLNGTGGPLPLGGAAAAGPGGPEDRVTLDESVGMALLTVLERLTQAERTAFILHDVFAVPFPEIAEAVGRTPDSVRQLASRARVGAPPMPLRHGGGYGPRRRAAASTGPNTAAPSRPSSADVRGPYAPRRGPADVLRRRAAHGLVRRRRHHRIG